MKRFFAFVLIGFVLGGFLSVGNTLRVFGREPDMRLNKSGVALLLGLDELAWRSVSPEQRDRFLLAREEVRARMYGSYLAGDAPFHRLLDSLFQKDFDVLDRIRAIDILRSEFPDNEIRNELGLLRQRIFEETESREFPRERVGEYLDVLSDLVAGLSEEEVSAGKGREADFIAGQAGELFVSHLYARSFSQISLSYVSLGSYYLDKFYSGPLGGRYVRVLEHSFGDVKEDKEQALFVEASSGLAELIIRLGQEKAIDSTLVLRVKSAIFSQK